MISGAGRTSTRHVPRAARLLPDQRSAADRDPGSDLVGSPLPGYVSHQQLRLELPETGAGSGGAPVRLAAGAVRRRADRGDARRLRRSLAVSSAGAWLVILDALTDAFPGVEIALIGKLRRDTRTSTSLAPRRARRAARARSRPLDCFDVELTEQLAVVEACDLFLAPHTGFGMAALAVGTPWLALSGGRWFEYFFNRVPFRSIIPDPERYPCFTQFAPARRRGRWRRRRPDAEHVRGAVHDDLDRIVAAARELLDGSLSYERSLCDYFTALLAVHGGDASAIWSIDGVHLGYI